jgi:hypothetical protein
MAMRPFSLLLAATALAIQLAHPTFGFAQDATPAAQSDCVPLDTGDGCLAVAPDSARVDLAQPTFSHPTTITNPLFPISNLHSVLMLGHVDGKPFRTEVTLLPETESIEWNGVKIETVVSQYMAYLDGRIQEVALDRYAQADDGSVWYFGEDVADYENGVVVTNEGTWLAGRDGPAAMIMPAHPKVGDVFRTETIPGVAFEEVTVKGVGLTVHGPHGPVDGAIIVSELHQDGTREDKLFAPGYGEFRTAGGGDLEPLALAVPTDALQGSPPAELETISTGAAALFDAAESEDWTTASSTIETMTIAWRTYRAGDVPPLIEARLSQKLTELVGAVDSMAPVETRQAALDIAQSSLDLQLQYRPSTDIDLARLDLWAAQVLVDAQAEDAAAVTGDVTTLELIRDRITGSVDPAMADQINAHLADLRTAAKSGDFTAVTDAATQLRAVLGG